MAVTVLVVIILILIAGYAAFFAVLNPQWVDVVTFQYSAGSAFHQGMPLWVLPIAGMLIGAILMAIALGGPWSTMRRAAALARQQLMAEREKSGQRAKKITALSKQVSGLQEKLGVGEPAVEDEESAEADSV